MADTKISALTNGSPAQRTDALPAQRGAGNVKLTVADIQGALNNFAATVAPGLTDDSAVGYAIGSSWLIPGTGEMWRARSVSAGAAVWVKVDTADFDTFQVGRYYLPFGMNAPAAGASATANILRLAYGVIKQRVTIDQLACRVTTAGTNLQLGIYKSIGGRPSGNAVAKTASFAIASASGFNAAPDVGNVQLEPGPYWFGAMGDAASTCIGFAPGPSASSLAGSTAITDILAGANLNGFSTPVTFGTWPDMTSATLTAITSSMVPAVLIRVASVP
jgi:hypothetical protein